MPGRKGAGAAETLRSVRDRARLLVRAGDRSGRAAARYVVRSASRCGSLATQLRSAARLPLPRVGTFRAQVRASTLRGSTAGRRLRQVPVWLGVAAVPLGVVMLAISFEGGSPVSQPRTDRVVPQRSLAAIEAAGRAVRLAPATGAPTAAPLEVSLAPPMRPHEIFGFAPYWTLPAAGGFDLRDLTTVAYFGVDVAPDGSIVTSGSGWNGYQSQDLASLVDAAHAAGDRVVLTAQSFDQPTLDRLTTDPAAADRLASQLIQAIQAKSMDGANLDLEGQGSADRAGLDRLVATVSNRLHAVDPHWQVTVDTYTSSASDPNGFFDVRGLAAAVDGLFVMAYDMENPGVATPNSPLTNYPSNVGQAMSAYASVVPTSKVMLGLPFYGYDWPTTSDAPNAPASGPPTPVGYSQLQAAGHPLYWDPKGSVPWTAYQVGGQWHEAYYENPQSLAMKASLAAADHLAGLGVWALGMDGNDPSMMAALLGHAPLLKLATGPAGFSPSIGPPPGFGFPARPAGSSPPTPASAPPPSAPPPTSPAPPPSSPPSGGGGSPPTTSPQRAPVPPIKLP